MASKRIWISRSNEGIIYETSLRDETNSPGFIANIEFPNPYDEEYLGSIQFIDTNECPFRLTSRGFTMNEGLIQNHFYPFGGFVNENKPLLLKRGLARRIELEVSRDLLKRFPETTPLAIGAHEDVHIEYCRKMGIVPYSIITLREHFELLRKAVR